MQKNSRQAKKQLDFAFTVVSVKDAGDECIVEGYANTSTKDRVGDVVMPKAFEKSLPTYLKNPILLENHNWDKVAGRTQSAEITDKGLYIKARISDARPDLKTMVREGCMSTFSIGYNEVDSDYDEATKTKVIKDLELLEISVVSVPANTEASFQVIDTTKAPAAAPTAEPAAAPAEDGAKDVKVERHAGESLEACVSRGIATLINEGKAPDQAAAIAYSMCGEKGGCQDCQQTKATEFAKNYKSFSDAVLEACGGELGHENAIALCDLYLKEGKEIMKLTTKQLIEALRAAIKSVPAPAAAPAAAAPEAGKADPAPAADAKPSDEAPAWAKELSSKLDAIAQACAQMLESQQAEEGSEGDKPAEAPKPGEEPKPADGKANSGPGEGEKALEELSDDELNELETDIQAQLDEIEDAE